MTSFLKAHKKLIFPMVGGVTCSLLDVDKYLVSFSNFAYTRCKEFVSLQIGKYNFIHDGFSGFAKSSNRLKLSILLGFFYSNKFNQC